MTSPSSDNTDLTGPRELAVMFVEGRILSEPRGSTVLLSTSAPGHTGSPASPFSSQRRKRAGEAMALRSRPDPKCLRDTGGVSQAGLERLGVGSSWAPGGGRVT